MRENNRNTQSYLKSNINFLYKNLIVINNQICSFLQKKHIDRPMFMISFLIPLFLSIGVGIFLTIGLYESYIRNRASSYAYIDEYCYVMIFANMVINYIFYFCLSKVNFIMFILGYAFMLHHSVNLAELFLSFRNYHRSYY